MASPLGEGGPDTRQHWIYSQLRTPENRVKGEGVLCLFREGSCSLTIR